jgi:uncharacterized protein (TIGR03435 family)
MAKLSTTILILFIGCFAELPQGRAQQNPAGAHDAPTPRPSFEVVSLKPSSPDARGSLLNGYPNGRLQGQNVTLRRLISVAYQVQDNLIAGTQGWMDSQGYEMDARPSAGADVSGDKLQLMLQAVLEDRFKLKFHRETRQLPVYFLRLAKDGVEGGPNMRANSYEDCVAKDTPLLEDALHVFPVPPGGQPTPSPPPVPCGSLRINGSQIYGRGLDMHSLTDSLSTVVGRPVVDKTGLKGAYNILLRWTDLPPGLDLKTLPPGTKPPAGLSVFTAVSEELGLKLESGKGPVEVIVVDSAEKASAN